MGNCYLAEGDWSRPLDKIWGCQFSVVSCFVFRLHCPVFSRKGLDIGNFWGEYLSFAIWWNWGSGKGCELWLGEKLRCWEYWAIESKRDGKRNVRGFWKEETYVGSRQRKRKCSAPDLVRLVSSLHIISVFSRGSIHMGYSLALWDFIQREHWWEPSIILFRIKQNWLKPLVYTSVERLSCVL